MSIIYSPHIINWCRKNIKKFNFFLIFDISENYKGYFQNIKVRSTLLYVNLTSSSLKVFSFAVIVIEGFNCLINFK